MPIVCSGEWRLSQALRIHFPQINNPLVDDERDDGEGKREREGMCVSQSLKSSPNRQRTQLRPTTARSQQKQLKWGHSIVTVTVAVAAVRRE